MKLKKFAEAGIGFTLIELLVVISVIGLLASVVLVSLNRSRVKARDAKRIADLHQIVLALELYYHDNGFYPPSPCGYDCESTYAYSTTASWDVIQTALSPYLVKLPKDPINNASLPWITGNYSYAYGNVGKTTAPPQYNLTAQLEDTSSPYRCGVANYRFHFANDPWCTAFGGAYTNQIYEASSN